jgi:hypothetical protein
MMRERDKAKSSPRPDKKIDTRGLPRATESVPGAWWSRVGTPDWLAKPARAAERKAK